MIKISDATEQVIERMPFIGDAMAGDLINLSELARQIMPQVCEIARKDVKEGAIVMALKRMRPKHKGREKALKKVLRGVEDISLRSNLCEFTFANSHTLINCQQELLLKARSKPRFVTISQGIYQTTIIVNKALGSDVAAIFAQERLLLKLDHLASVTLLMPVENVQAVGLYNVILRELAYNNVNVVEVVSTAHEVSLIVAEQSLEHAFVVLKRLISQRI